MLRFQVVLLLAVLIPISLFAQDDQWYLDKPIADIRFEGLSSVSENELLGLIRPYLGQPLTASS